MRRRSFLVGAASAALRSPGWGAAAPLGTLAFLEHAALRIRSLPDGKPQTLARGTKIASPRFSPSGQWIAYASGGAAHVVSIDGSQSAQLVSTAGASQWAPGRDELLVSNPDGVRVFSATNQWKAPVRGIKGACLPVVFSPDGREIVYADVITSGPALDGVPQRTGRVCRIALDARSRAAEVLTSRYLTGQSLGGWSGDYVVYWEDPDFSASVAADGLELFHIPVRGGSPVSLGLSTLVHDGMLAFSPDGERLAVAAGNGREEWENKRIAVIDVASGRITYLTDENMAAVCPAWSPDGKRIAFSAAPGPSAGSDVGGGEAARRLLARRRIWVKDLDRADSPRPLTRDASYRDEEPMWSRDGAYILFGRIDNAGKKSLWLMQADGGDAMQVAGPLDNVGGLAGADGWFGFYGYIDWRRGMDWFLKGNR